MRLTTKHLVVNKLHEAIEMVNKRSLDDDDDVIITTKHSSNKKKIAIRKEAEYPTPDLEAMMQSPEVKKFGETSKFSKTVGKASKNTLISSLPVGLRETSYFDNTDQ